MYIRIRNIREDKDLTQSKVAEMLYINRRTYSSYENGIRTIPPDILVKLSLIFGVSVDYLLGLTSIKTPYPRERNLSCEPKE